MNTKIIKQLVKNIDEEYLTSDEFERLISEIETLRDIQIKHEEKQAEILEAEKEMTLREITGAL